MRTTLTTVALLLVIIELGGIWREIRQMRNEQVKNDTYALPIERRSALRESAAKRMLESAHVGIPRENEFDFPAEAEAVSAPPQNKAGARKTRNVPAAAKPKINRRRRQ